MAPARCLGGYSDRMTAINHQNETPMDTLDGPDGIPASVPELAVSRAEINTKLRQILCDVLGLEVDGVAKFDSNTGLFGHIPELDSMAVAGLLTEMEDRLNIVIDDEDVDGEMLETYGGLLGFAEMKAVQV